MVPKRFLTCITV